MVDMTLDEAKIQALARFEDRGPDHINCAQAVVCFASLVMGADPELITVARYFGGGLAGMGETCGAITGTSLALGLRDFLMAEDSEDSMDRTRAQLQDLLRGFAERFGAYRCADLTGCDLSTPEGHDLFVASGANKRCPEFVGWMCDQLAPLLVGATSGSDT